MSIFRKIASAMIAAVVLAALPAAASEIVDVTGRRVEMALPAKRILLGEARQIHIAAALKGEHVFDTIVGWRDDLIKKDPDSYAAYVERFPEIEKLPRFGYIPTGDFSLEAAIALKPDVLTLNLEARDAVERGEPPLPEHLVDLVPGVQDDPRRLAGRGSLDELVAYHRIVGEAARVVGRFEPFAVGLRRDRVKFRVEAPRRAAASIDDERRAVRLRERR